MKDTYSVKDACALCNLSRRQLLYCEDIGLLGRVPRDTNNYRYYSGEQIVLLHNIRELRDLGFSFNDLADMIHNTDVHSLRNSIRNGIMQAQKELEISIAGYDKKVKNLMKILEATYIAEASTGVAPADIIEVVEVPEQHVLAYEYTGNFLDDAVSFYKNYKILDDEIDRLQLTKISNRRFACTDHYDVESATFNLQENPMTVFYEIKEADCPSVYYKKMPAFKAVSTISVGDYGEQLIQTYKKMFAWAKQNNISLSTTAYEDHPLDLSSTLNSDIWVTRVDIEIN